MKRLLLTGLLLCLVPNLSSCRKHIDFIDSDVPLHNPSAADGLYVHPEGTVRFVQYNVGVFSKHMEDSSPLVARILKDLEADVVGMNELDSINRRHSVYQMKLFAEYQMGADWNWHYFRAMAYRNGSYGNGVMTKYPVTGRWGYPLEAVAGSEPRCLCAVETDSFVAISAHLDNSVPDAARTAVVCLNEYVSSRYGDSGKLVVLMADTNTRKNTEAMTEMLKCWTIAGTDNRFDYVLVFNNKAKYRVVGSAVVMRSSAGDVASASDHYPVFADIAIL